MIIVILSAIIALSCFSWFLQSRKIRREQQRERNRERREATLQAMLELKKQNGADSGEHPDLE